jgi:hypothetical protein
LVGHSEEVAYAPRVADLAAATELILSEN